MKNMKKEKSSNDIYRRVEAMYYTDKTTAEIARECGISKIAALEILQKVFAKNEMRKGSY